MSVITVKEAKAELSERLDEPLEDFAIGYVLEGEEELAAYVNDALEEKGLWR